MLEHNRNLSRNARALTRTLPDLERKVAFLRDPAAYPGRVRAVEAIETHMSWVFLAGDLAWKLKKPVAYPFLDFRELASRRRFCEAEVRLNRRLAPQVYLGVTPLTHETTGHLAIAGAGETVEWLVRMRRLDRDRMLDRVIARGTLQAAEVESLASRLARFYRTLPAALDDPALYMARLRGDLDAARDTLVEPRFGLAGPAVIRLHALLLATLDQLAPALAARVRAGRIVEGHGDLRPEHVSLEGEPAVIDCLEFSERLRTVDTADDLALLALECERLGAPSVGIAVFRVYREVSGDDVAPEITRFYKAGRAFVRARLAIDHLRESRFCGSPVWRDRAERYLALSDAQFARA